MCNNPSTQTPQRGFMAFLWAPPPQNLPQKLGGFFLASRWWSFRSCHSSIDRWWIGLGSFEELSWPFLDTKTMGVRRSLEAMTSWLGPLVARNFSAFRLAWPPDLLWILVGGRFFGNIKFCKKVAGRTRRRWSSFWLVTRVQALCGIVFGRFKLGARWMMASIKGNLAWCCVHRRSMLQQEPASSAVFEVQPMLTIDTKTLISKIKRCISIAKMKFLPFGGKHIKLVVLCRHTQWYPNPVCEA